MKYWPQPPSGAPPRWHTVAVLEENGNGEGADLALHAGCERWVYGAHDAQRFHHQVEDLGAELRCQVNQAIQDAGQERLKDLGALRGFQLVTVTGRQASAGDSQGTPPLLASSRCQPHVTACTWSVTKLLLVSFYETLSVACFINVSTTVSTS